MGGNGPVGGGDNRESDGEDAVVPEAGESITGNCPLSVVRESRNGNGLVLVNVD